MPLPRRLSEPGPILEYLESMMRSGSPQLRSRAIETAEAVRRCLLTPEGAILLDLLDKSILERSIPISSDPRALDANNAQGFIALDLRRIASDETDARILDENAPVGRPKRR